MGRVAPKNLTTVLFVALASYGVGIFAGTRPHVTEFVEEYRRQAITPLVEWETYFRMAQYCTGADAAVFEDVEWFVADSIFDVTGPPAGRVVGLHSRLRDRFATWADLSTDAEYGNTRAVTLLAAGCLASESAIYTVSALSTVTVDTRTVNILQTLFDFLKILWPFVIIEPWERGVRKFCGHVIDAVGPGIYVVFPWFMTVDGLSIVPTPISSPLLNITLRDGRALTYSVTLVVQVADVVKAFTEIDDYRQSIVELVTSGASQILAEVDADGSSRRSEKGYCGLS